MKHTNREKLNTSAPPGLLISGVFKAQMKTSGRLRHERASPLPLNGSILSLGCEAALLWTGLISKLAASLSVVHVPNAPGDDKHAIWLTTQGRYLLFQRLDDCLLDLIHLWKEKGVILWWACRKSLFAERCMFAQCQPQHNVGF